MMKWKIWAEITWIVECKQWKTRVSKLHVLALREIVADVGADRGILLSESGFQSGAIEATNLTNVKVTSLADVSISARDDIYAIRLLELHNRIEECNDRYWDIPKDQRIEHGLRSEVGQLAYTGALKINLARDLLSRALRGFYPFSSDAPEALIEPNFPEQFHSAQEVFAVVESIVDELDHKLSKYEAGHRGT